jgi:hypothetical protein
LKEEVLKGFEDGIQKRPIWGTAAACPVGSLAWNETLAKKSGERIPTKKQGEDVLCFVVIVKLTE